MEYDAELYSWETYVAYGHDGRLRFRGIIKNDKKERFPDGLRVFTSLAKEIGDGFVTTLNTTYKLCGKWEGPWTMRTLEDVLVEVDGPVHFNMVRYP